MLVKGNLAWRSASSAQVAAEWRSVWSHCSVGYAGQQEERWRGSLRGVWCPLLFLHSPSTGWERLCLSSFSLQPLSVSCCCQALLQPLTRHQYVYGILCSSQSPLSVLHEAILALHSWIQSCFKPHSIITHRCLEFRILWYLIVYNQYSFQKKNLTF